MKQHLKVKYQDQKEHTEASSDEIKVIIEMTNKKTSFYGSHLTRWPCHMAVLEQLVLPNIWSNNFQFK